MSSTDFSAALAADQDIFAEEEAIVELIPDTALLSSNSVLSLLEAFGPSVAEPVANFADALPEASGVSVTSGLFDASLLLADGTGFVGSLDVPAALRNYADLAVASEGTATLASGILEATVTSAGQTAALPALDLSTVASALALDSISAIDATVPLTNGAFALDLATVLGPVSGTVDIAGGDLNLDLVTPFGQLVADVDFADDAIFPFLAPVPGFGTVDGAVDFNSGSILASLGPFGSLAVPLSTVSGSLTLLDGIASLDAAAPVGFGLSLPIDADFEIGPLASEYIAEFVQDLDGTGTLTDGILEAVVESPLGLFATVFDVVAFTNQGADFFAGVDGVIEVGMG
ncbi:MAG: hypothetical protein WBB18_04900, partial [Nodosilinea sp.]